MDMDAVRMLTHDMIHLIIYESVMISFNWKEHGRPSMDNHYYCAVTYVKFLETVYGPGQKLNARSSKIPCIAFPFQVGKPRSSLNNMCLI